MAEIKYCKNCEKYKITGKEGKGKLEESKCKKCEEKELDEMRKKRK